MIGEAMSDKVKAPDSIKAKNSNQEHNESFVTTQAAFTTHTPTHTYGRVLLLTHIQYVRTYLTLIITITINLTLL